MTTSVRVAAVWQLAGPVQAIAEAHCLMVAKAVLRSANRRARQTDRLVA